MKTIVFFIIFFSTLFVSCVKDKRLVEKTNETVKVDTAKTGNKIGGLFIKKGINPAASFDPTIGEEFLKAASKGTLKHLKDNGKGFLPNYTLKLSDLKTIYYKAPKESVRLNFTLVQVDDSEYKNSVDLTSSESKSSILYLVVSYMLIDEKLVKDDHYLLFNLKPGVSPIKIDDRKLAKLTNEFKNEISKTLDTYHANNTISFSYNFKDIEDLLKTGANYDSIDFMIGEIINIDQFLNDNPNLGMSKDDQEAYKKWFKTKAGQLNFVGKFTNPTGPAPKSNSYFDMSNLKP